MRWADVSLNPSERTLREFACLWLGVFLLLSGWQGFHHERWVLALALAAAALSIGVLGLLRPGLIRPVFKTALTLTFPVGWIVSHLVLAIFFGVITPLGLIFRMTGRDALGLRKDTNRQSYWIPKPQVTDARRYFRQF